MSDDLYNERWEMRACETCGHVRRVKVRDDRKFVPDGTMVKHEHYNQLVPGGEFRVVGETYERACRACRLEAQIAKYQRAINKLARQVADERARQRKSKEGK